MVVRDHIILFENLDDIKFSFDHGHRRPRNLCKNLVDINFIFDCGRLRPRHFVLEFSHYSFSFNFNLQAYSCRCNACIFSATTNAPSTFLTSSYDGVHGL